MEAPLCCVQKYGQNAELWNSMFEILGSIYVKLTHKEHLHILHYLDVLWLQIFQTFNLTKEQGTNHKEGEVFPQR